MESPTAYPESPLDPDDAAYPCKGCGEILEEGKAFELAGNRWHIDCFRCNTCSTLLDSDANLLLLGDGSLICNNCTYSCSNCGNKIEDLAILTGDQAFCANCFKCRNCKKKIENLRYARTSQGIFCMDCHEALMARRRKKTQRSQRQKLSTNNAHLDKSLPAIPPPEARKTLYSPEPEIPSPETSEPTPQMPSVMMPAQEDHRQAMNERRDPSPASRTQAKNGLVLPSTTFRNNRGSVLSHRSDLSVASGDDFHIPIAFDPTPPIPQSPHFSNSTTPKALESRNKDYFVNRQPSATQKDNAAAKSLKNASPHIAYQEKSRQLSTDSTDPLRRRREGHGSMSSSTAVSPQLASDKATQEFDGSPSLSQTAKEAAIQGDSFKLQEAPRAKSSRNSKSETTTPRLDSSNGAPRQLAHSIAQSVRELKPETEPEITTPRASYEYDSSPSHDVSSSSKPMQHPSAGALASLPKRGDSLDSAKRGQAIPRKEVNPSATIPQVLSGVLSKEASINSTKANGGKTISMPIDSPNSKSIFDTPNSVQNQLDGVTGATGEKPKQSFVAPRAPPPLPSHTSSHSRQESTSTPQSKEPKSGDVPGSPALPRYSAGVDFSMEEDMARILGEENSHDSFLRKVSNSVRHGRSFSDKGGRLSKERWPRSPAGAMPIQDLSSPSTGSPETRDDIAWFKNELRRERQRAAERERKISELEAALDSNANIKQVNSELREKRSTMVILDTQKEIVVRELEVLTEHIAAAKKSGEPLDLGKMSNTVLKEFAESLQKLKDSFSPQIEESIQKRNDLVEEIEKLTQAREKTFQEFEQLSSKNSQLAELNNQLVHQIQELYKTGASQTIEQVKPPNGLGIYSHHKDRSQISIDSRTLASEISAPSSGTTLQADDETATATIVHGPHVVNIRKGQPKKFNWMGKGQNVAKGVTKGLKGAFSSTQQNYGRELQFAETAPYGATPPGQDYANLPRNNQEPMKQGGFSLFNNNQKPPPKSNGMFKASTNESTPSLQLDPSTHLFGSDLEQRAEFEKVAIPGIVARCIEEVELRGMDSEGIYRKSGGNSQVQFVREGFERSPLDYDLSDPDLDINAVTSCLKQYFRRLPNPLITYEVYDSLLDTTSITDTSSRIDAMHNALNTLPKVHFDVLEFLMFHLSRVVDRNEENLMTSSNVAVVFAPTIMRPESLSREMTDTAKKNEVVQFLVENCRTVFKS